MGNKFGNYLLLESEKSNAAKEKIIYVRCLKVSYVMCFALKKNRRLLSTLINCAIKLSDRCNDELYLLVKSRKSKIIIKKLCNLFSI